MQADARTKWNLRYEEKLARAAAPEPNPMALRFRTRVQGGILLDAACGLGAGIAALIGRVDLAIGVDLSERALAAARRHWGRHPKIRWIQGDVAHMVWPGEHFAVVCAFGFTDWDFLRQVPNLLRRGGLFLYQGFSPRELAHRPGLDPGWTSTPQSIAALFPGWAVEACEENREAPFRVSFAAVRPRGDLQEPPCVSG